MQFLSHCILITLSVSTALYGAAGWIEQVKKAPSDDTVQFHTAKNAMLHDNPTLFITMLNRNPALVNYKVQPTTPGMCDDLLKNAIGTLRADRSFFVAQLLQHGATISAAHINCCIAALRMRPDRFRRPLDYFCIEDCVLSNLQKLFCIMSNHLLADTKKTAQRALQVAIHEFIDTDGSAIYNIKELLAAVDIHPAASSSGQ